MYNCVFPTPVGVFLDLRAYLAISPGLPHARGGVSPEAETGKVSLASSPRPWGCFRSLLNRHKPQGVFPTPVGVFLMNIFAENTTFSLPHARGGVSI